MYRRLERARAERDIPEDCDTRQLAAYYVAVVRGMAVAAKDGGSTESLMSIVDLAMKAWPRP
jgi:hypothetical protein